MTATPSSLPADGTTTSTITTSFTSPVPDGTVVNFTVAAGSVTLSAASATTTGSRASITARSATPGVAIITSTSGGEAANVSVAFNSTGITVQALKNGLPNNVALANNTDRITIRALFTSIPNGTPVIFTSVPVAIGGSSGANAQFITNTNTITVLSSANLATTTVASGSVGGATIQVTSGALSGSAYVKFLAQPTSVAVSVAVMPDASNPPQGATVIPAIGALQFDLSMPAGTVFSPGSEVARNSALGSTISALQNASATTVGMINANGFTTDPLPVMSLTAGIAGVGLPTFSIATGTIEALQPNGTAINLVPANFDITMHFNTDTF